MPIFEVRIWVSESRYYTVEAQDEDCEFKIAANVYMGVIEDHFYTDGYTITEDGCT